MAGIRKIGLIGAGAMGGGFGRRFVENGFAVLSPLAGRSSATLRRAADAGIQPASYAELADADIILSIVPPAEAAAVAELVADAIKGRNAPLYVDGNALAPETKLAIAGVIKQAGGRFADGVIIGGPVNVGEPGPRLYVSGVADDELQVLRDAGVDVRLLEGPVGAAAALKMCYAGFNKGIIGLTTAALLAAERAGAQDALIAELEISQKLLLDRARATVPGMYPKAYRWVAEFEEIAHFNRTDPAMTSLFAGFARFFEDRAVAQANGEEPAAISALLQKTAKS